MAPGCSCHDSVKRTYKARKGRRGEKSCESLAPIKTGDCRWAFYLFFWLHRNIYLYIFVIRKLDFVFSPDVKYVAAISEDGCLRVIDALSEVYVSPFFRLLALKK